MVKVPPEERILNEQQKKAVEFGAGPFMIIAGAGTGKTTVVTERIKHLIAKGLAQPQEILALTFTEKAAREMEERADTILPYGYTQMWISTFHKFCDRVLRSEAIHVGLNPAYRLLTDADATMLLRKHLFSFKLEYFRPLGNPTKFIGGMLQHFSRLQDEDVAPNQYIDWVNAKCQMPNAKSKQKLKNEEEELECKKYLELGNAYKTYGELKTKEGVMDFADLITNTLWLFRERPNVLKEYQSRFKYILVDEFQDTNIAQNELVALLAGRKQNITAVCDDDQCLPPSALIETLNGNVPIRRIRRGDVVVTAVGKGYLSTSAVSHVHKTKKKARFITLVTQSGVRVEATDNHRFFCHVPGKKFGGRFFYVYLMQRRNLGWRLGITDDLAQRLKLERSADRIIAIRACESEEEARFYEAVYALRYGIPTYPFKPRKRMVLTGAWLSKLFQEIDSEKGAQQLAKEIGIDLTAHHFALGGVVRGNSARVKVIVRMCFRRNRTKWAKDRLLINPLVSHRVQLETSSVSTIAKLRAASIPVTRAKRGWKVGKQFANFAEASKFARRLTLITQGIFEVKMDIAKRNVSARFALVIPAGNIFPGMHIPVVKGRSVIYEQVVKRYESVRTQMVYDLEVERTHNFIANSVVVHNSIYKFRGAAVSNVLSFRKHFPKATLIVLSKNYRSTQEILDASYTLIQNNNPDRLEAKEGINKRLVGERRQKGTPPKLLYLDRVENEADAVAKEIKRVQGTGYRERDFAILLRANNHAEPFVRAFIRHGIPFQFLGPGQLFRQPEVKDLIAYLQVLENFENSVALFRVLSMEFFGLNARDLAAIANFARKQNISLFEACEVMGEKTVGDIVSMIHRHLGLIIKETGGQLLYYFLQDSGMLKSILEHKAPIDEHKAANISKFFSKLKTYEAEHEDSSVSTILDWILLAMELGESPLAGDTDWSQNDAVNILTIHSAKGLEFPVVFLVNLVSQRFPTMERHEQIPIPEALIKEELPVGDYHLEEERRLFYVGMTRARDLLYFTGACFYGEGKREKKLSPFVYEVLGTQELKADNQSDPQLSLLEWKKESEPSVSSKAKKLNITYVSYSQIETFRLCPLHFKLRYILGIPTPPSPALSFGSTMHAVMRQTYERVQAKEMVNKKIALELLSKNWIREGYTGKRYEEEMKKRGERYLDEFLKKEFSRKANVLALEESFTVPITDGGGRLRIGGKIDRIDALPGGKIEIIDYKTGRMSTRREADTNLQLSMYAIAATEMHGAAFQRKVEDLTLTLYFFDTQEKISTTRTAEQLAVEKQKIIDVVRDIESSDFRCSGNQLCATCEYHMFCGL